MDARDELRFGPNATAIQALIGQVATLSADDVHRLARLAREHARAESTTLMQAIRRATISGQAIPCGANAVHDVVRALIDRHPDAPPGVRAALADAALGIALDLVLSPGDVELLLRPWRALEAERAVAGATR